MSDLSAIREAREKARNAKKEYLIKEVARAITNGNYEFIFGFNSAVERDETEAILRELNVELRQDKLYLMIGGVEPRAINITEDKKLIYTFAYTCVIKIRLL